MKQLAMKADTMKYVGRLHYFNDILWMIMSGSGVEFAYTGRNLEFTLCGREAVTSRHCIEDYPRFAIYVDGIRVIDDVLNAPEKKYVVLEEMESKTVHVQLIKLSECAMSMLGLKAIEADTESIEPAITKSKKIEFIGDSITCGYGIDDENCEHHFSTATEDVTRAFAYKTSRELDVDYSMFSTSGHGIISGYTDNINVKNEDQRIPDRYHSLGLCFDTFDGLLRAMDVSWDFSKFQPDLVVINLGTNDDSYCQDIEERQLEYMNEYKRFLYQVRENNPKANILCVLGLMGNRLYPYICMACREYEEESEDRIFTFELPEQDGTIGYVADYHPLECFHEIAAEKLTAYIIDNNLLSFG